MEVLDELLLTRIEAVGADRNGLQAEARNILVFAIPKERLVDVPRTIERQLKLGR